MVLAATAGEVAGICAAIAGPATALIGLVGKIVTSKLNAVGDHLKAQDAAITDAKVALARRLNAQDEAKQIADAQRAREHRELGERIARLEGPIKQIAAATENGND